MIPKWRLRVQGLHCCWRIMIKGQMPNFPWVHRLLATLIQSFWISWYWFGWCATSTCNTKPLNIYRWVFQAPLASAKGTFLSNQLSSYWMHLRHFIVLAVFMGVTWFLSSVELRKACDAIKIAWVDCLEEIQSLWFNYRGFHRVSLSSEITKSS